MKENDKAEDKREQIKVSEFRDYNTNRRSGSETEWLKGSQENLLRESHFYKDLESHAWTSA